MTSGNDHGESISPDLLKDTRILKSSLQGMSDEEACSAIVEPVWPDEKVLDELSHLKKFTKGQQVIYCSMLYAREVDNGGLKQFLGNSSSLYYSNVIEALDHIKAAGFSQTLQMFIGFLPMGKPALSSAKRREHLRSLTDDQLRKMRAYEDAIYKVGGFEVSLMPH